MVKHQETSRLKYISLSSGFNNDILGIIANNIYMKTIYLNKSIGSPVTYVIMHIWCNVHCSTKTENCDACTVERCFATVNKRFFYFLRSLSLCLSLLEAAEHKTTRSSSHPSQLALAHVMCTDVHCSMKNAMLSHGAYSRKTLSAETNKQTQLLHA